MGSGEDEPAVDPPSSEELVRRAREGIARDHPGEGDRPLLGAPPGGGESDSAATQAIGDDSEVADSWRESASEPEPILSVTDAGYRSGSRRARLVQVLLALWVVLAAVAAAASLVEFRIVSRLMDNPLSVSLSDVMASDDRQVTIAVIWLMGVLVTGIAFIVWMLRIYDNVRPLGGATPRYSRGWVIGGWLVPILNLWRPKEIMDDLWVASDPDPSKSGRVSRASLRLVHVWWALWILGAFVGGFFGWNRNADLAELRNYAVFDVVTDLVLAAGAIAALLVVDRLTRRQEMRAGGRFVDYQPNVTTTSGSTSGVAAVLGVVGLATLAGTFLAFTTTSPATSTTASTVAVELACVPTLTQDGRVTDAVGLLERESDIEGVAEILGSIEGTEIAVVLVENHGDCSSQELAAEIANTWTVGVSAEDPDFVLLLDTGRGFAVVETGPRIQVSDEVLASVAALGREDFAAGDFDSGVGNIMFGLQVLSDRIADRPHLDPDRTVLLADGSGIDRLELAGYAQDSDGSISLTRKAEGLHQAGAAWFGEEVLVGDGFETQFVFEIDHISWYTIGDGFAFVIQDHGSWAVGEGASGNGYQGIRSSVAVEFDTIFHSYMQDPVFPIPGDSPPALLSNHVAVHSRGTEPNWASGPAMFGSVGLQDVRLYDRQHHIATIRYTPGMLSVFVDASEVPVLEVELDLNSLLGLDDGKAYIGFTAGTEPGSYADFLVHAWAYDAM